MKKAIRRGLYIVKNVNMMMMMMMMMMMIIKKIKEIMAKGIFLGRKRKKMIRINVRIFHRKAVIDRVMEELHIEATIKLINPRIRSIIKVLG